MHAIWLAQCTIRISSTLCLQSKDALELFKKTLPSPSLLQVATTGKAVKARALEELTKGSGDFRLRRAVCSVVESIT